MIEGIDISSWQGEIDWQKAYQAGARFAIIRAGSINNTTGVCYEDTYFRRNALLASALMPVSFYWFFRPNHSALRQAEYFTGLLDLVKDKITLPHVWCDIEVAGAASVVKSFCELVAREYPIGIYTNPNTALYLLTGDKAWMAGYPLWLADWSAPANVPAPWTEYKIWQYAVKQDGLAWGMKSNGLDHDQMVENYLPPPPPPPDDHTEINARLDDLNARVALLTDTAANLAYRVTLLEQAPPPPPPEAVTAFRVTASVANARRIAELNAAGRPIMAIYEPRVQFHTGESVRILPLRILADGGADYYQIHTSPVPEPLYLRAVDGVVV